MSKLIDIASRCILLTAGGCLALLLAGGCSRPADIDRPAALHGRVMLKGKPLADALVFAVSEAVPTAAPASASTARNGSYAMPGVPAGRVRIAVVPAVPAGARLPCNRRFLDWRTSGISADVVAGDQPLDISLE